MLFRSFSIKLGNKKFQKFPELNASLDKSKKARLFEAGNKENKNPEAFKESFSVNEREKNQVFLSGGGES